uniref:Uncharacterized protein n=1 Tax=Anguilla anguilla TaxID=7936 RepID=A0A0E9PSB5_ANGAN
MSRTHLPHGYDTKGNFTRSDSMRCIIERITGGTRRFLFRNMSC